MSMILKYFLSKPQFSIRVCSIKYNFFGYPKSKKRIDWKSFPVNGFLVHPARAVAAGGYVVLVSYLSEKVAKDIVAHFHRPRTKWSWNSSKIIFKRIRLYPVRRATEYNKKKKQIRYLSLYNDYNQSTRQCAEGRRCKVQPWSSRTANVLMQGQSCV